MKKLYLISIFALIFTIFLSQNSYANILFSKTYIILDAKHRSDIFQITNLSGKKMRYKAKLVYYKQLENGQYETIETPTGSDKIAGDLLYMSPKTFVLEPKATQTMRVMRKNFNSGKLKDIPEGEYRAHLLVMEDSEVKDFYDLSKIVDGEADKISSTKKLSINIYGLMGTSIPVIVRKGDNLTAEAKITKAQTFVTENGVPMINVEISRSGNKSVRGDIIVSAEGKEIASSSNFAVYLSTDKRNISIPLKLDLEDRGISNIKRSLKELENKKIYIKYIDIEEESRQILSTYTLK